jgi:putative ABC transport system substrate-binding protein
MRRREFITLLGGTAATWPVAARAQQPAMPVIGFLSGGTQQPHLTAAFDRGLGEAGYANGRNVTFDYRRTTEYDQLPALAAELVRRQVAIIVAGGAAAAGLAAKAATPTIPIVFVCGEDPVKSGLVASLSRPGGNMTGVSFFTSPLEQKRIELLRELLPSATRMGILVNPTFRDSDAQVADAKRAANALGLPIIVANANSHDEIEQAFLSFANQKVAALLVASDPFLFSRREQIVGAATRNAMVAIYNERRFIEVGGLLSYGTDVAEVFHQAGIYSGRILSGTKPADLPVVLPSKFELIINLKVAKALGLEVPTSILLRADEVIE